MRHQALLLLPTLLVSLIALAGQGRGDGQLHFPAGTRVYNYKSGDKSVDAYAWAHFDYMGPGDPMTGSPADGIGPDERQCAERALLEIKAAQRLSPQARAMFAQKVFHVLLDVNLFKFSVQADLYDDEFFKSHRKHFYGSVWNPDSLYIRLVSSEDINSHERICKFPSAQALVHSLETAAKKKAETPTAVDEDSDIRAAANGIF